MCFCVHHVQLFTDILRVFGKMFLKSRPNLWTVDVYDIIWINGFNLFKFSGDIYIVFWCCCSELSKRHDIQRNNISIKSVHKYSWNETLCNVARSRDAILLFATIYLKRNISSCSSFLSKFVNKSNYFECIFHMYDLIDKKYFKLVLF